MPEADTGLSDQVISRGDSYRAAEYNITLSAPEQLSKTLTDILLGLFISSTTNDGRFPQGPGWAILKRAQV